MLLLEEGNIFIFIVMSTLILSTIFLLLWLLWKASNFLVTKILIIGPSTEYINDQLTLISNENATAQEEMDLFFIESQFRRL